MVLSFLVSGTDRSREEFTSMLATQSEMRSKRYSEIGLILLLLVLGIFMTGMKSDMSREPFTFVQISDTQLGYGGYQHDLDLFRKAVKQINALKPDFVVF